MGNWTVRERAGLAVLALAVIVAGLGFWASRSPATNPDEMPPLTALAPPQSTEILARGPEERDTDAPAAPTPPSGGVHITEPPEIVVVHVAGAVRRPGVYTLRNGARVEDAIRTAGGFKPSAAQDSLNRAERLRDGDQVYVASRSRSEPSPVRPTEATPRSRRSAASVSEPGRARVLGDRPPPSRSPGPTPAARPGSETPAAPEKPGKLKDPGEGTVNINTAGAEELQRLPGIGPAMAERILDYRQEIGSFNAPEQLQDVRGIGEKKYAAMEPFVRVK